MVLKNEYYTECFKKSFTTLKAYRNLYRGHTQRFELSKCSKTHRLLPRIVIRNCYTIPFMHVVPNTATASAPAFEIKMATFTGAERARCVFWFEKEISH